jgi:uridine kinase
MKAALLISGYLRTFELNLPEIIKGFKKTFDQVDIYLHITTNEAEEDKYLNNNKLFDLDQFIIQYTPKCLLIEPNKFYSSISTENNIYNTWSKFYKLNLLKKVEEDSTGVLYDVVFKLRPDFQLISGDFDFSSLDSIIIPEKSLIDKSKLTSTTDLYICDTFAYGPSHLMDEYCSIYTHLPTLCSQHGFISETILYHYLTNFSIPFHLKPINYTIILSECNIFAICGDSGSGKTTLSEILKGHFNKSFILEGDRYHKWDRFNSNWEKFTHLNPESNYLTKMNDDIFDLKIGKQIYQVDYDHKTGKFTDKQVINPSNNLIVCGLHSLYNKDNNIYNLKIFMDTDEELKRYWKINRDTKKRNKTPEQVITQIESRYQDYKEYILPQKYKSDVIINFYPKSSSFEEICLKITVSKHSNIHNILNYFSNKNINFSVVEDNKNCIIDFPEYIPLHSNLYSSDSFYDYILHIILNLVIK